jgi:hypothetical protein
MPNHFSPVKLFRVVLLFGCITSQSIFFVFIHSATWTRTNTTKGSLFRFRRYLGSNINNNTETNLTVADSILLRGKDDSTSSPQSDPAVSVVPMIVEPILSTSSTTPTPPAEGHDVFQSTTARISSKEGSTTDLMYCVVSAQRKNGSYLALALQSLQQEQEKTNSTWNVKVTVVDVSNATLRDDIEEARVRYPDVIFEKLLNKTRENCTDMEMLMDSTVPGQPPCSVQQHALYSNRARQVWDDWDPLAYWKTGGNLLAHRCVLCKAGNTRRGVICWRAGGHCVHVRVPQLEGVSLQRWCKAGVNTLFLQGAGVGVRVPQR